MKTESMHICCNIDDTYAPHCGVMLTSFFEHCNGAMFEVHILISQLNETNRKYLNEIAEQNHSICHFHQVHSDKLHSFKYSNGRRKLSEATYYRLFLSSVLDESISKVLYLDSDMIIQRDLSPLFSIDLTGYALAATKDLFIMTDEYRLELSLPHGTSYFNAGMMLINLDYWRKTNAEDKLIKFAMKERPVNNQDQDALNAVFSNKWFKLSPKWSRFFPYNYDNSFFENSIDKKEFIHNPAIIHFFDLFKPWNKIPWVGRKWMKYKKQYYSYLKATPWGKLEPQKLVLEKYQKYGLYKHLFIFEFNSLFLSFGNSLKHIFLSANKLIFLPFLLILKIYYQIVYFKKSSHSESPVEEEYENPEIIHKGIESH